MGVNMICQKEKYEKNVETIEIEKCEFKLLYSSELPALTYEEFEQLCNDIALRGVLVSIIIDEYNNVIDGVHRLKAAAKQGYKDIPFQIRPGLTEEEKMQLARDLNLHRRHLSHEQIQQFVLKLRKEGKSLRQIGDEIGVSHEKVRKEIVKATVNGLTVGLPETIKGKDGKTRPAKVKRKRTTSINANNLRELNRATEACQAAGSGKLPAKAMNIKRVEHIAREKQKENLSRKNR